MDKCKNCGHKIVKFPVFKEINGKKVFIKENWRNLFKMEWLHFTFFILIIFLSWAYAHDTDQCRTILEHPISFCNQSNACKILEQQEYTPMYTIPNFDKKINSSDMV